ncbi:hypothetical protein FM109_07575 [Vibrio casei]|nr:hypothetical protein FM109_07575 [Vibrio casei]
MVGITQTIKSAPTIVNKVLKGVENKFFLHQVIQSFFIWIAGFGSIM